MRTSIRCQEVPHDGYIHAEVMDRALPLRRPPPPHVLLRDADPDSDGANAGIGGRRRASVDMVHPPPLLLRVPVPPPEVPAKPAKEFYQCLYICHCNGRPHLHQLALRVEASVRPHRHRRNSQLLLVGRRRPAIHIRQLRRLPSLLAWILHGGICWALGLLEAFCRFWCHAMVSLLFYICSHHTYTLPF